MLRFAAYHEFDGDYGEPVQKSTANRYESTNSRFAGVRSEFCKLVLVEKKNKKGKRKKRKESEGVAAANQNATTLEIQNLFISEKKGVGEVIDGLEVGINGMRIGGKRRITIPPSMGVLVEKKSKKRKRKKTKESEGVAAANQNATTLEIQNLSISEKKGKEQTEAKPSQVRTIPNGLVIEELSVGKPDGESAASGKKVSVTYTGKLEKDGKIFASTDGRRPFEFRLGVGEVIDGWEVGINGMRIGEKRRITIPPSMGYGDKRVGNIPRNSSLVFDVELVDVSR